MANLASEGENAHAKVLLGINGVPGARKTGGYTEVTWGRMGLQGACRAEMGGKKAQKAIFASCNEQQHVWATQCVKEMAGRRRSRGWDAGMRWCACAGDLDFFRGASGDQAQDPGCLLMLLTGEL